jgi:hypothetical protein
LVNRMNARGDAGVHFESFGQSIRNCENGRPQRDSLQRSFRRARVRGGKRAPATALSSA